MGLLPWPLQTYKEDGIFKEPCMPILQCELQAILLYYRRKTKCSIKSMLSLVLASVNFVLFCSIRDLKAVHRMIFPCSFLSFLFVANKNKILISIYARQTEKEIFTCCPQVYLLCTHCFLVTVSQWVFYDLGKGAQNMSSKVLKLLL